MNAFIDTFCNSLDQCAVIINNGGATEKRLLNEAFGWNVPSVTFTQLASISKNLAISLRKSNIDDISSEQAQLFDGLNKSVIGLFSQILPHFFNGNAATAVPIYLSTFQYVESELVPYLHWAVPEPSSMPAVLARRLQRVQRELDTISPEKDDLIAKIKVIHDANNAAEALPITLSELNSAKAEIIKISASASETIGVIKESKQKADEELLVMNAMANEAQKLAKQCIDASAAVTSVGLGASFEARANKLNRSVFWWVVALTLTLLLAMGVGAWRLETLRALLSDPSVEGTKLWIHILLSFLSVGAPIWFGWLASKQIGQRFRLAEDYAFKSSVAKAYEGYRLQAVRIDPELEKALFTSALMRLDEQPLSVGPKKS